MGSTVLNLFCSLYLVSIQGFMSLDLQSVNRGWIGSWVVEDYVVFL